MLYYSVFSYQGLNMHTEDILRDPSVVKTALSHGLITFCWGDDNNSVATIKYLKELGLNGVIYDRIEEHMEQKQSVFLTDDGEDLLQVTLSFHRLKCIVGNRKSELSSLLFSLDRCLPLSIFPRATLLGRLIFKWD